MIRYTALAFALIILIVGCKNKVDDKLEKEIIHSLYLNNWQLNVEAEKMYDDLTLKAKSSTTEDRAYIYLGKIKIVDSLLLLVDTALNDIASRKINYGNDLYDILINYKNNIFNLDKEAKESIKNNFSITNHISNKEEKAKNFFINEVEKQGANLSTAIYRNKAILLRNIFFDWCTNQFGGCNLISYSSWSIACQNSTHFKQNEKLRITAGAGAFSKKSKLQVLINGDTIPINNDGVAEFEFNVGNKKGKFSKKVSIQYYRPNGEKYITDKEIIYTVD